MIYVDTSALVPRYLSDGGPDPLAGAVKRGDRILLSDLAQVEFRSAILRRVRGGRLASPVAARILEEFAVEASAYDWVPLEARVLRIAVDLVERRGLRSLDALQLAGAVAVARGSRGPMRFASLDARLNAAARAEGLELLPA